MDARPNQGEDVKKRTSPDTKEKIIEAAFELFGRFGFEGTSVRMISKKSEVNIAAINYHFGSKDQLFWEVMSRVYTDLEVQIKAFAANSKNTIELAMATFDYFQQESLSVKNAMKMILDGSLILPDAPQFLETIRNPMGPPGGTYFAFSIQRDVGFPLSREKLLWGVKSVFGSVFHWSVMACSEVCQNENDPLMTVTQLRKDVEQMVTVSMNFLKSGE